jgi:prepilin-type N-terminal cleavage/methylation domain-containing protein/prepilin-type processing-associated H-X9-DG protein
VRASIMAIWSGRTITGPRGGLINGARACRRRGFSLVELLVVIGIIALLIALLMPVLARTREMSRRTKCLANLRSIGQAMFEYANVYRDHLPNGNGPQRFVDYAGANQVMTDFNAQFVQTPAVFWCPSDVDPAPESIVTADPLLPNSARVSYDFYCLYWPPEMGPVLTRLGGRAPLAWDQDAADPASPHKNHGNTGGNVVFADGHGEWQNSTDWDGPSWPDPAELYYP